MGVILSLFGFAIVVVGGAVVLLRAVSKSADARISEKGSRAVSATKRRPTDQTKVYADSWEKRGRLEIEPFLSLEVAGESFHIETIRRLDGGRLEREEDASFKAFLIPEDKNPHDPGATAIWADGFGLVGHIGRSDAWKVRVLRKRLLADSSIGVVSAKLVGRWGEDDNGRTIPPGVIVYVNDDVPDSQGESLNLPEGWRTMGRAQLSGRRTKDQSIIGEGKFQPALKGILGRSQISPPTPFEGILVPARVDPFEVEPTLVVCDEKEGPVGSLSYSAARRYRRANDLLSERGEVGLCPAVCIPEGKGFGVKIRLPQPDEAEAAIVARSIQ